MNSLGKYYLWKVVVPMVFLLLGSVAALLLMLWGISELEAARHRTTVFALVIPGFDAPFWVVLAAGLILVNGIASIRHWSLITAEVARNQANKGLLVTIPIPVGRVVAVNFVYVGSAALLFYAVRGALQ